MTHHVRNYPPRAFFTERYRTSGSDSLALWFIPFGVMYVLVVLLAGLPHTGAILMGGATTAVLSAVIHDMTHVSGSLVWRVRTLRRWGRWHRIHHSKMGRNFGIVLSLWDWIFRTSYRGSGARSALRDPIR